MVSSLELLTAIGGKTPNRLVTKTLLSLTDNKWTEQFPLMPTKGWGIATAVCSGKSLVVAGGEEVRLVVRLTL